MYSREYLKVDFDFETNGFGFVYAVVLKAIGEFRLKSKLGCKLKPGKN